MEVSSQESCPLPEQPVLAAMASALNQAGVWAYVMDRDYRLVYITQESRLSNGGLVEMCPVPLGAYVFGTEYTDAMLGWSGPGWSLMQCAPASPIWVGGHSPMRREVGRNCASLWTRASAILSTDSRQRRT